MVSSAAFDPIPPFDVEFDGERYLFDPDPPGQTLTSWFEEIRDLPVVPGELRMVRRSESGVTAEEARQVADLTVVGDLPELPGRLVLWVAREVHRLHFGLPVQVDSAKYLTREERKERVEMALYFAEAQQKAGQLDQALAALKNDVSDVDGDTPLSDRSGGSS